MVDRQARDQVASAIRSYMDEKITAFQFDDALEKAASATEDRAVREAHWALWLNYDDCNDHKIVANKWQWDFFNRLRLLLESDAEIQFETVRGPRRWRFRHAVAAASLVAFLLLARGEGWDPDLMILCAIPFGVVSMILSFLANREERRRPSSSVQSTVPFPSVGSLLSVRRTVPGFTRSRFPNERIAGRRIRSPLGEFVVFLPIRCLWLFLSPVALLFQMWPRRESETRIKVLMPNETSGGSARNDRLTSGEIAQA